MDSLTVDRRLDKPLYAQVRDGMLRIIRGRDMPVGSRLPTVSKLAKRLGVTEGTVRRALKDLTEAGWVVSYVGRGTFVAEGDAGSVDGAVRLRPRQPANAQLGLAARRLRRSVSKSLENLQSLADRPGMIRFTAGTPDGRLARDGVLDELTEEALQGAPQKDLMDYGPVTGLEGLRTAVAERVGSAENPVDPEQVLITNGSQQAIALLGQLALDQDMQVLCETPCYMGVPQAFEALGHWVESVRRDEAGPRMGRLEQLHDDRVPLFYLCHELHNPMGLDLEPRRQSELIAWAKDRSGLLAGDAIFTDLRLDKREAPDLLGEGGAEHVVLLGSFSKAFMCGLRIGWMVSTVERIGALAALKKAMDISSPPLMQGIALALVTTGEYDRHLERAREHYRVRRDRVLDRLGRHMPEGVHWTRPAGGFHMWVELPEGYSSLALFLLAVERGVEIVPGPRLDTDHRFVNGFRLSYGSLDLDTIDKGVELLAEAVKELFKRPPGDVGLSGVGDFL